MLGQPIDGYYCNKTEVETNLQEEQMLTDLRLKNRQKNPTILSVKMYFVISYFAKSKPFPNSRGA